VNTYYEAAVTINNSRENKKQPISFTTRHRQQKTSNIRTIFVWRQTFSNGA